MDGRETGDRPYPYKDRVYVLSQLLQAIITSTRSESLEEICSARHFRTTVQLTGVWKITEN